MSGVSYLVKSFQTNPATTSAAQTQTATSAPATATIHTHRQSSRRQFIKSTDGTQAVVPPVVYYPPHTQRVGNPYYRQHQPIPDVVPTSTYCWEKVVVGYCGDGVAVGEAEEEDGGVCQPPPPPITPPAAFLPAGYKKCRANVAQNLDSIWQWWMGLLL